MKKKKISIKGIDQLQLFGFADNNLKRMRDLFDAKITARGSEITIEGEQSVVAQVEKIFSELISLVTRERIITDRDLETVFDLVRVNGSLDDVPADETEAIILYKKDGFIKPKGVGQTEFYKASVSNDIVFVIGPAGTGKTFMAVAIAVAALRDRLVRKIVLTRPAVEAGEKLGYLPGDFMEKIDPYLRPLYDALNEMIPGDKLKKYIESGIIEIVPLAYMRGRTLNSSFVILDEAQNTSFKQMKMCLTRLGVSSKCIITGDVTQIDLPSAESSGLVQVESILNRVEGISFVYLTEQDVVRHKLVRDIIKAYDAYATKNARSDTKRNTG